MQLLPREAVRPLYRRARDEARRADALADGGEADPLALLARFCRRLLPLPPFEVWREDLRSHPEGHFADLEESADVPTADAPSTMEVRSLEVRGRPWLAHLRSFREAGLWRGYISFEEAGGPANVLQSPTGGSSPSSTLRSRPFSGRLFPEGFSGNFRHGTVTLRSLGCVRNPAPGLAFPTRQARLR